MDKSKELMQQAGILPNLQLATKKPTGGIVTTGPHTVVIVDEKLITTTNDAGESVPTMRYIFEESGEKKQYDVEVKDKNGNLDYKIQRIAQYEKGQVLVLECIKKGMKNYIDIRPADKEVLVADDDATKFFEEQQQS